MEASGAQDVVAVRRPGIVPGCCGLVIPGGESTSIGLLMMKTGIGQEVLTAARSGVPVLATCAGLVLSSRKIEGEGRVNPLNLIDITVCRNAFGPQRESFEADLDVLGFESLYRAVFIRAPAISACGDGVTELARIGELVVAAKNGNVLALAFHPELTDDLRFHQMFLDMGVI